MATSSFAVSEAALAVKAQQGDREAYGDLVREHYTGVVNVVYRMCGDVKLAEDSAQETFIRAWQHLDSFRPGTSLRSWLYRIGINAALDVLRREKVSPADLGSDELTDPATSPEAEIIQRERSRLVQQAILSLSEANRAIIILREYGGLSYQEIAAALDVPAGTVMSRLNYARGRLRELLTPEFGEQI